MIKKFHVIRTYFPDHIKINRFSMGNLLERVKSIINVLYEVLYNHDKGRRRHEGEE